MAAFHDETRSFREQLVTLIEEHWETLRPKPEDDDLDPVNTAEMGATYPSGWVLLVTASSIENPEATHALIHVRPDGQSPYLTVGILYEGLQVVAG